MRRTAAAAIVILAGMFTLVGAQPKPAAPAATPEFTVSPMRVQEFKACDYVYIPLELSFNEFKEKLGPAIDAVTAAAGAHKFEAIGYVSFVYQGMTPDPTTKFHLEVGMPVNAPVKDMDLIKYRKLDAFRCATVMYSGSIQNLQQAYGELYKELLGAGMQPSGENREHYLYWEGEESPNNVVLIMVGIQ